MSRRVSKTRRTSQFRQKLPEEASEGEGHSRSSRKQQDPVEGAEEDLVHDSNGNSNDNDNKHQLLPVKPARLTRKNLALFNKMARKKGTNKTSTSTPISSSALESSSDGKLSKTTTTSSTARGFAIKAYKNGILDRLQSKPPINLKDLQKQYAQSRGTASPTESEYGDYVERILRNDNEATLAHHFDRKLLKEYKSQSGYRTVFNQPFTGIPPDGGFNNGLSAPQPDFVEGLERPEYLPFLIDDIAGAVLYEDDPGSLVLPQLAGEFKAPGKDMRKAEVQAAYNGAALVYARNQALSLIRKPDPPGHAQVSTFTTDGTILKVFAHYATTTTSDDGTRRVEYHQYPIKSTILTDSHSGFNDGRRGLRNVQDRAFELSCDLRDQLIEHYQKQRSSNRRSGRRRGGGANAIGEPTRQRKEGGDDGRRDGRGGHGCPGRGRGSVQQGGRRRFKTSALVGTPVTRINSAGGIARPVREDSARKPTRRSERLARKAREKEKI